MAGRELVNNGTGDGLERSSWSGAVNDDFQLFEPQDSFMSIGREGLDPAIESSRRAPGLQDYTGDTQKKNRLDKLSASGRRKFVIPNVPDFGKLLDRCTSTSSL